MLMVVEIVVPRDDEKEKKKSVAEGGKGGIYRQASR